MWKALAINLVVLTGCTLAGIIHDYPDHRSSSSNSGAPLAGDPLYALSGRYSQSLAPIVLASPSASPTSAVLQNDHSADSSKVEHQHKIKHEHATSHQTFKIHHFHPVKVYVKKEDQHLLKHPKEIGGVNHKLKQIHPEAQKSHGHGHVLENHTEQKHGKHHHDFQLHSSDPSLIGVKQAAEQIAHLHELTQHAHDEPQQHGVEHHGGDFGGGALLQFHDINVRSSGGHSRFD